MTTVFGYLSGYFFVNFRDKNSIGGDKQSHMPLVIDCKMNDV